MDKHIEIPACENHGGVHLMKITIPWSCPICGGPRGEPCKVRSYDGSTYLACDGWENPCGHIDLYKNVREEWFTIRNRRAGTEE